MSGTPSPPTTGSRPSPPTPASAPAPPSVARVTRTAPPVARARALAPPGVGGADPGVLAALAAGNLAYERRFGHVFLIFASGRSAEDLLAALHQRLDNDPEVELRLAAARRGRDRHRRPAVRPAAGRPAPGRRCAPAGIPHGRLVRRSGCRRLLPGGERGVRGLRSDPALPRAAAAEPIRLLDLPGELSVLGGNRYGKSGIRLVRVDRAAAWHDLVDLTIDVTVEGDFAAAYGAGDNSAVLPTDTRRGTVYALAGQGPVGEPEAFGLRLAGHFLDTMPAATLARIDLVADPWTRIEVGATPHPHAFTAGAGRWWRPSPPTTAAARSSTRCPPWARRCWTPAPRSTRSAW